MRALILLKHAKQELVRMLHPRAVLTLWLGDRALSPALVTRVQMLFDETKADLRESVEWEAMVPVSAPWSGST